MIRWWHLVSNDWEHPLSVLNNNMQRLHPIIKTHIFCDYSGACAFGYSCILLYLFFIDIHLREFVWTTIILAPSASEVGLELRLVRHFAWIGRWWYRGGWIPRGHFLCAVIANASNIDGDGRPLSIPSHPKLHLGAQAASNRPKEPQGSQREAKVTPRRAPWEPEAPQRGPKGNQNELQRHPKETNTSENYIHIRKSTRKLPIHRHTVADW